MRDHNEFCAEINRRKSILKEKKKQRERLLTCGAGALVCIAVVAISPWKYITNPEIVGLPGEGSLPHVSDVEENKKDDELTAEEVSIACPDNELNAEGDEDIAPEETYMEASTEKDNMESIMPQNVTISGYMGNEEYFAPSAAQVIEMLLSHEGVTLVSGDDTLPDGGMASPETDAPSPDMPEANEPEMDEDIDPKPDTTEATEISSEEVKEDLPQFEEETISVEIRVLDNSGRVWVFTVDHESLEEVVSLIKNLCN